MTEISCRQAHTGEKPRRSEFKTAVSTNQISKLAKHRKGRKLALVGEQKDRQGRYSATRENQPPQRQAGGCRSAGSHERAGPGAGSEGGSTAQPGTQRLLLVQHKATRQRTIGKKNENK